MEEEQRRRSAIILEGTWLYSFTDPVPRHPDTWSPPSPITWLHSFQDTWRPLSPIMAKTSGTIQVSLSLIHLLSLLDTLYEYAKEFGHTFTDTTHKDSTKPSRSFLKTSVEFHFPVRTLVADYASWRETSKEGGKGIGVVVSILKPGSLVVTTTKLAYDMVSDRLQLLCRFYKPYLRGNDTTGLGGHFEILLEHLRIPAWYTDVDGISKILDDDPASRPWRLSAEAQSALHSLLDHAMVLFSEHSLLRLQFMNTVCTRFQVDLAPEVRSALMEDLEQVRQQNLPSDRGFVLLETLRTGSSSSQWRG